MPHRGFFNAVSDRLRHDTPEIKLNGNVKGFVPSDKIVRYLLEIERRRENGELRPRARTAH
jgi:hypothetical protein